MNTPHPENDHDTDRVVIPIMRAAHSAGYESLFFRVGTVTGFKEGLEHPVHFAPFTFGDLLSFISKWGLDGTEYQKDIPVERHDADAKYVLLFDGVWLSMKVYFKDIVGQSRNGADEVETAGLNAQPDPRAMGLGSPDYCALLPKQRNSHEAQGRVLFLPYTGLTVIPVVMGPSGSWHVEVAEDTEHYKRGGYRLAIPREQIETAIERQFTPVDRTALEGN